MLVPTRAQDLQMMEYVGTLKVCALPDRLALELTTASTLIKQCQVVSE